MNKKGQYFSFDAIIASVLFAIALLSVLGYWFSLKSALDSNNDPFFTEATRVSERLIANSNRVINTSVFEALAPLDEDELKSQFSTPYNLTIIVTDPYSNSFNFTAGDKTVNASNIAKVRRVLLLYNSSGEYPAVMDIYVYR
ncbi:hypothetical protein KJ780_01040 [Candidatus Micrarchaeota archaeon]|nr:hypothetical protein [Candidatus Micrarchaeota archaeon]